MAEGPALGFAGLLRQLRTEARLTQEELAEAAGLSPRSVSDLERGINRTARRQTAVLLAGAPWRTWRRPGRGRPRGRSPRRPPAGCRGTSPASPAARPISTVWWTGW